MYAPTLPQSQVYQDKDLECVVYEMLNEREDGAFRFEPTRVEKAAHIYALGYVQMLSNTMAIVVASDGQHAYHVNGRICTCDDYAKRGAYCKHATAVILHQRMERRDAERNDPQQVEQTCPECAHPLDYHAARRCYWQVRGCSCTTSIITIMPQDAAQRAAVDLLCGECV